MQKQKQTKNLRWRTTRSQWDPRKKNTHKWMNERRKENQKWIANKIEKTCWFLWILGIVSRKMHLQCPTLTGSRNRSMSVPKFKEKQVQNVFTAIPNVPFILCVPIEVTNSIAIEPKNTHTRDREYLTICHWIIVPKAFQFAAMTGTSISLL